MRIAARYPNCELVLNDRPTDSCLKHGLLALELIRGQRVAVDLTQIGLLGRDAEGTANGVIAEVDCLGPTQHFYALDIHQRGLRIARAPVEDAIDEGCDRLFIPSVRARTDAANVNIIRYRALGNEHVWYRIR